MKDWRAKPSIGGIVGIVLTVLALAAFGVVLWLTFSAALETSDSEEISSPGANLGTFGLVLACCGLALIIAFLVYRTWRFYQIHYYLDRNAITVELGGKKQIIPLANVRYVVPAEKLLDQLRQDAYGEDAPTDPQERDDGVKFRTFSQPRARVATAERTETTSAADSSFDDFDSPAIVEGEVIEAETVEAEVTEVIDAVEVEVEVIEGSPAADSGSAPEVVEGAETQASPAEPEPVKTAKAPDVPGHVAFNVKTRPLTSWPGFYTNQGWLASIGEVQFYSTQPFAKTLLVSTTNTTYAISPVDFKQFMIEYRLRRNLGAIEDVEEEVVKGRFLSHPLWKDWLGRGLILAGVLANLALFAFILWRFQDLPPIVRLHYNKFGVVDRLESASAILWLPGLGLLSAIVNSVLGALIHPRERVPALLLYGSILAVQLMVWIAALGIMINSGSA
jgi:hypothetical protein